jgi:hypothetical protein
MFLVLVAENLFSLLESKFPSKIHALKPGLGVTGIWTSSMSAPEFDLNRVLESECRV